MSEPVNIAQQYLEQEAARHAKADAETNARADAALAAWRASADAENHRKTILQRWRHAIKNYKMVITKAFSMEF